MPPDDCSGGRERHVRDVNAPFFSNDLSKAIFVKLPTSVSPLTPDSTPRSTTGHPFDVQSDLGDSTTRPIYCNPSSICSVLTPISSCDSLTAQAQLSRRCPDELIHSIFPSGLGDVDNIYDISSKLPRGLWGAVVDWSSSAERSVYVCGLTCILDSNEQIKDLVVRVLDLADEDLEADEVIFVLEKKHVGLRQLLQGLLYVGGSVVKDQAGPVNDSVVLVGIEL